MQNSLFFKFFTPSRGSIVSKTAICSASPLKIQKFDHLLSVSPVRVIEWRNDIHFMKCFGFSAFLLQTSTKFINKRITFCHIEQSQIYYDIVHNVPNEIKYWTLMSFKFQIKAHICHKFASFQDNEGLF